MIPKDSVIKRKIDVTAKSMEKKIWCYIAEIMKNRVLNNLQVNMTVYTKNKMLTEEREMKREYEGDIRVNSREMEKANERKKGERREKTIPNEK